MPRTIRMLAPVVLATAAIAIVPANAVASTSVGVPSVDFGTVPVGTSSAVLPVGLTSSCTLPVAVTCPGFVADAYYVHPSATGDFATTDNCPNPLGPSATVLALGCTINLTFTPSAAGPRTGTLSTGTIDIAGLVPGPTVSLAGTGIALSGYPSGNGGGGGSSSTKKKCKKKRRHRSAEAAKKKKKKCRKRR